MTANQITIQAGMAALQAGEIDAAIESFAEARRTAPGDIGLLRTLAALYQHAGRFNEAWSVTETGLALQPDDSGFAVARIAALDGAGCTAAALTLARRQIAATPDDPQLVVQYGTLLLQTGDAATALQAGRAALARHPAMPALLAMSAEAAFRSNDHTAARGWIDQAVALEPENRSLRMARATMLLSLGDWDQGLKDYEYRLQPDTVREIVRHGLHLPRWQDQDMTQHRLLVVSEQGVGDQMRFVRDILSLRPFTGGMMVECAARLVPLFRRSLPADIVVVAATERSEGRRHVFDYSWLAGQPRADAWIEMGSLMLRLLERGVAPDRPQDPR